MVRLSVSAPSREYVYVGKFSVILVSLFFFFFNSFKNNVNQFILCEFFNLKFESGVNIKHTFYT